MLDACMASGVPNIEPPRGHIPMLKKYYTLYPAMRSCIVNTFGFGYSLNSELLQKVATEGQGSYGFIPDVGCGQLRHDLGPSRRLFGSKR